MDEQGCSHGDLCESEENLKWESLVGGFKFHFFGRRLLGLEMEGIRFHEDRPAGFDGTRMLTCAASDADIIVHLWESQVLMGNHAHRLRRTVLRTGRAVLLFGDDDTVVLEELGFPYLGQFLLLHTKLQDRPARTDLSTQYTLIIAVAHGIVHPRLKDAFPTILEQ